MIANDAKLVVRLPYAEKRRIKILAASEGLTIGQALHEAFDAWVAQLQSRKRAVEAARGTSTAGDSGKQGQPSRGATLGQDQRPAAGKPSSTPSGGQIPGLEAPSLAWLSRTAELDWSKCPAAQRVKGKTGDVWVFRGTDAPLADVLQSVADGNPFLEIAEVFEISLQQLIAVLQFAAEGLAPAGLNTEAQRTRS